MGPLQTLSVCEVKCPPKVPDEASPWETCLPTSGPGPTHKHKHTHTYISVLKRFRKDICVSHMKALWHSCYEWGRLWCREESTWWRLMCEASHWASVKKQNKAATQRNDSELSTDYELHFLQRCWSLTDVSIKYRYQTQVLVHLIHKQFYQITFVNYAFILKKGGCWMTDCLLLFESRIHKPGKNYA